MAVINIKNATNTYRGLPKSIYAISMAKVVNSMGNFVFPLMTFLLTIKLGMSESKAGYFLLICAIVQVPGSLIGGKLTDHLGRKKIMVTFMMLQAFCFVICAFLGNSMIVPRLFILSSFFSSISGPAGGAMINDLTVPENRQSAFSLLYLSNNVGSALGLIIAGLMFKDYMMLLFIGDAITTLIAVSLIVKYVKETKPTHEQIEKGYENESAERAESGGLFAALLRRPVLLTFALIDTIYSFAYAQTHFSLPLQSKFVFGVDLGPKYYGTFNSVNCIVVIVMTTLIISYTKKIRDIYNVAIAGLFYSVGFGMLFFVRSFWRFILSTIIWTIGEILSATNVGVYIANRTPISHRGRFNSIIQLISGTGFAVSPYVMGQFIMVYGVVNVWPVIFILSLCAAVSMFLLGIWENRKGRDVKNQKYNEA